MSRATDDSYRLDDDYSKSSNISAYSGGPLRTMSKYCPSDLDGGQLSEWVVTTFFPVMEQYNPNFQQFSENIDGCAKTSKTGAVTVLFSRPQRTGAFGHIAMVIHNDTAKLSLPSDLDTEYYVSFNNYGKTMGAVITGTKADHVKFGKDLAGVTDIVTLHNADVDKIKVKWQAIKDSRQMFDLMEWNCGRTLLEVLQAGFPTCKMPVEQLWTPWRTFQYIKHLEAKIGKGTGDAEVTLESVHERHIDDTKVIVKTNTEILDPTGLSLLVAAIITFFLTLLGTSIVSAILLRKLYHKEQAEKQLERNLAKEIIHSISRKDISLSPRNSQRKRSIPKMPSEDGLEAVEEEEEDSGECEPCLPAPVTAIVQSMDDGALDGEIDFEEFSAWAHKHNLDANQAKIMWKSLDANRDGQIDKKEWDRFIQKRPNLSWLVMRMNSAERGSLSNSVPYAGVEDEHL